MSSLLYTNIKPLNVSGSNFSTWETRIRDLIDMQSLSYLLQDDVDTKDDKFQLKDLQLRSLLKQHLDDQTLLLFKQIESGRSLWKALQTKYGTSQSVDKISALEELYTLKLTDNDDPADHLLSFQTIVAKLLSIDAKPSETDQLKILIKSIKTTAGPFHYLRIGETRNPSPSLDSFIRLYTDSLAEVRSESPTVNTAMLTRPVNRHGTRTSNSTNDSRHLIICDYCHRHRHSKIDCYKRLIDLGKALDLPIDVTEQELTQIKENVHKYIKSHRSPIARAQLTKLPSTLNKRSWFVDTGATAHMTNDRSLFTVYKNKPSIVELGNGSKLSCLGTGTLTLSGHDLHNVLLVPELSCNLFAPQAEGKKLVWMGDGDDLFFKARDSGETMLHANLDESTNLYQIEVRNSHSPKALDLSNDTLWHDRLGHPSWKIQRKLGLENDKSRGNTLCDICVQSKRSRASFPPILRAETQPLEILHMDLVGPITPISRAGYRYFLSIRDQCTRKIFAYPLKSKAQTEMKIRDCIAVFENELNLKVKAIHSDNGMEFLKASLRHFLKSRGIRLQTSAVYTPEQNGIAEAANKQIITKTRSLLLQSHLPKTFWPEAIHTACYLINRLPSSAIEFSIPERLWSQKETSLQHLRPFGCDVWSHIPSQYRSKFDATASPGIMLGYSDHPANYVIWDLRSHKILITPHITFNESSYSHAISMSVDNLPETVPFIFQYPMLPVETSNDNNDSGGDSEACPQSGGERLENIPANAPGDVSVYSTPITLPPTQTPTVQSRIPVRTPSSLPSTPVPNTTNTRPVRIKKPSRLLTDPAFYVPPITKKKHARAFLTIEEDVHSKHLDPPQTLKEALARDDADLWKAAVDRELEAHKTNGTWSFQHLPLGKKAIGCRWVFTVKNTLTSAPLKYKARLVAQGFSQVPGIDFDEVYAPVVKWDTIRLLSAIAAVHDFEIDQMDVRTAFLNGDLEEDVYMKIPTGISEQPPTMYCKLNKALYGLKQAPRTWNKMLDDTLLSLGLEKSKYDSALYSMCRDGIRFYILVWVDDLKLVCSSREFLDNFKKRLMACFDMEDMGPVSDLLGIKFNRDRQNGTIHLSQEKYISSLLAQYSMQSANPVSTPLPPNEYPQPLVNPSDALDVASHHEYRKLIGSLLYLSTCTRPDLSFAVNALSRFQQTPSYDHLLLAKRILRYLKGTLYLGITYGRGGNDSAIQLQNYSDANFAGDSDRHSVAGYLSLFGGGPISWRSRKISYTSLSTTEAEYVAASMMTQEVLWLSRLLSSLGENVQHPIMIWLDNQPAIAITKNPVYESKTKHLDVRYHFIRDYVADGTVKFSYVPTESMLADILTKPVTSCILNSCLYHMGLLPLTL